MLHVPLRSIIGADMFTDAFLRITSLIIRWSCPQWNVNVHVREN